MKAPNGLLNRIKPTETQISDPLQAWLDGAADGIYKSGKQTLTISTVLPVVDEITGTWTADGAQLQTLPWFTGQETASQSLLDRVAAAKDITAWFAFDTDTQTQVIPGSANTLTDTWLNKNAQLKTTAWYGNNAAATAAAAAAQVDGVAFAVSGSNAGVSYVYWDSTSQSVKTGSVASTTSIAYALSYTAASSVTTTTVDALRWDGTAVVSGTFLAGDTVSWASGWTDGYRLAEWDTNKRKVEGLVLTGLDGLQLQIV